MSLVRAERPGSGPALAAAFAVAAALLVGAAVRLAVPLTVLGLAIFGVAHVALELRYVLGRFAGALSGRVGHALVVALTVVAFARLVSLSAPTLGRPAEVVAAHAVVGLGAWVWLRGGRRGVVLALAAVSLAAGLAWTPWYFFVLTHLHNLVPVAFLWDWSRRLPAPGRATFRAVQLAWAVGVPALIVCGVADGVLDLATGVVRWLVGDGAAVLASSAPPGASALVAVRFCATFAFGQAMHYVVWLGFFPAFGADATRTFEADHPGLRGWRFWVLIAASEGVVGALLLTQWAQGKALYGALATYHVYLEFPLLVGLWLGASRGAFARRG